MKRTNSFTMIEIVLAMGVIVIGVISVLGLFPVGLNASRDAIAESYACESADQFLHLIEYRIRNDIDENGNAVADGWEHWIWDGAVGNIPVAGSMGSRDVNPDVSGGGMWNDGTLHDIGNNTDGIYKVVTYVDSDDSDDLSDADIRDFEGIMAVWQEELEIDGTSVPKDIAIALKLEVSWPANAPYANRKKAVYHYELFNR